MSIFTSNRNLSTLIQAALKFKETTQTGAVKEEKTVEVVVAPQVSKCPEVSPLVVNNNFFLTYNNVDMKEGGVSQKVDIAKSYRQDSSVAEEVFGRDYANAQPRSTSTGARGAKFSQVRQMASEDLAKLAEAMRKQLRLELGDDYNSEVVERVISEATNSTLQYFSDNKSTRSSRSYRAQQQDCGFVFAKRSSFLSVKGVYSYNTKALADMFVKNFNAGISRNTEELNTAYAKAHEKKVESFLPEELQEIERRIYEDKNILKQVQARVPGRNISSLEDYSEVVSAVLLRNQDNPDLGLVVASIADCIKLGVQEMLEAKSDVMEEQAYKMADVVVGYLDSCGVPCFDGLEEFLESRGIDEKVSYARFLTSFIAEDRGISLEDAAEVLDSPKAMTRAMTRSGVVSSSSSFSSKVRNFVKNVVSSPTFKAAVCVASPTLARLDKYEKMQGLISNGDTKTAVLMACDPFYHVGEVSAAVSSEPVYNAVMIGLDFVPVVGEAAGIADFAISLTGAVHSYTYDPGYGSSFPFKTDGMDNDTAANLHLAYDTIGALLGLIPGMTSGMGKTALKGILKAVDSRAIKDIGEFIRSGRGMEVLKSLAAELKSAGSVDEAVARIYAKCLAECPNLAAMVKNILIKNEAGGTQGRVDTEVVDELPGGGGDLPPMVDDNRIKDLNGTEMPGINFQPAADEGADWSGSMGDKNKVSGSDNNGTGFSDSYQAGFFQDGKMVTIEPTEENEAKLRAEIEEQIKNDYGSLDNVEHRITFVYDDKGDIKAAVVEVKSKEVIRGDDAEPGNSGVSGDGEPKRVGDRGYGLGKVGEDVYGRGYFPGVGLNVYDYMGEGGRIDVERFISDWELNGGEAYSYSNSSSINNTLTAIFEAQQSGNWAKFWNNVGNFENYSKQDISKLFGNSAMQNAESNIEKAMNYFEGIGPDETIVVGIVDGMFVAHGEVVYDSNGNICTFLKGWGWKIEKPVGHYMGSDGVLYYQYSNGGLLSEEELKKKAWGCNLGLAVSDGKI